MLNYFPKECELTRYTKVSHKLVLGCSGNSFRTCICESFVTGKLEEALQYFSEAISCNPTSAILFANRGTNYFQLRNTPWRKLGYVMVIFWLFFGRAKVLMSWVVCWLWVAGVYVKMKKPNAAIHDAQVALKVTIGCHLRGPFYLLSVSTIHPFLQSLMSASWVLDREPELIWCYLCGICR